MHAKMCDLKNEGQSDGAQHPQLCVMMEKYKSKKILKIHFFWLVFTISEILATLTLTNIDLENVGQGHGVKYAQSCRWKTDIDVCKSHNQHFYSSSHRFLKINVSNV